MEEQRPTPNADSYEAKDLVASVSSGRDWVMFELRNEVEIKYPKPDQRTREVFVNGKENTHIVSMMSEVARSRLPVKLSLSWKKWNLTKYHWEVTSVKTIPFVPLKYSEDDLPKVKQDNFQVVSMGIGDLRTKFEIRPALKLPQGSIKSIVFDGNESADLRSTFASMMGSPFACEIELSTADFVEKEAKIKSITRF